MSIAIDLPVEMEEQLLAEAAELGLSLPEYVLRLISTGVVIGNKPRNGAELVSYWQHEGVIGSRREIDDSRARARQIRNEAEHRQRF